MNLSPYELVFGQKPKTPIKFNLFSTTDSLGICKFSLNSPRNSFPNIHTDNLDHHQNLKNYRNFQNPKPSHQKSVYHSLSPLLTVFYIAHSYNISCHPGREPTYTTITENYYFHKIKTWLAIVCLNCQTIKSMPIPFMALQQPFLEVSPNFNYFFSMDTKGPISQSSDGNSYVYVVIDAFTH